MYTTYITHPHFKYLLLGLFAVVALTSCGGEPAAEAEAGTDSPLNDLLGIPITDEEAMRTYEEQLVRDAEALVVECMSAKGFDYLPVDPQTFTDDLSEGTRSFAETQGLGLTSLVGSGGLEFDEQGDPNAAYIDSLSEQEREAFGTALWGPPQEQESDFGGGCSGEAYAEAFSRIAILDSFGQEIDALFQEFEGDERIVEIREAWSRCMKEAGHEYDSELDLFASVGERLTEIAGSPDSFVDPVAAQRSVAEIEHNGVQVRVLDGSELTNEAQALLDGLADEERAAAVASWDCAEPHREVEAEVLGELEKRFVDENGDAITALVAADG